ncbi:seipin isoform X1 [Periplaneta americana]|uniref:seipin isoform X1 n=1 Tax=Periplaneta americana TaxID=6978 RepID=UPI0037E9615F
MPTFRFLGQTIHDYRQRTVEGVNELRELAFRGGIVALVAAIILWIAIFLYVAFYYTYMPSISHVRPVHLQFESCKDTQGICSFPSAHVQLTKRQQLLMVGQQYKMYLDLEMPESPTNQKLGMFMVCIQLHDKDGQLVDNSCRSTMLHYRSYLLHTLTTLMFSPMMMFGNKEEKQNIILELFADFEEDQNHPVTDIYVEIQSRHVELYSATLHVHAHFTGLRYFMFHWPVLAAAVGITSNLFFIVLICVLSWWHLHHMGDSEHNFMYGTALQSKESDSFTFKGEPDDSSFEDASLLDDSDAGGRQFIAELPQSESFQMVES